MHMRALASTCAQPAFKLRLAGVLRQGQQAPAHWAPALPVAVAASPRKPVALSQTSSGSGESSGQGSERGMQLGASVAGLGERVR